MSDAQQPDCRKRRKRQVTARAPRFNENSNFDGFVYDGAVGYPVKKVKGCTTPGHERVVYVGYGKKAIVRSEQILPVTAERISAYKAVLNEFKEKRQQLGKKEKKQGKGRGGKRSGKKKGKEQDDSEEKSLCKEGNEDSEKFGPCPSLKHLPRNKPPGACVTQRNRSVYFTMDEDTPQRIAEKFGTNVDLVVYINGNIYEGLHNESTFKEGIRIVLPLGITPSQPDCETEGDVSDVSAQDV
mmetsp:Transcript_1766/g.2437  ORF Transcript_1766/g.2437 Transcript_1766/m.2437 type:complete len:241 (-) Transcript_1766:187-909(-)